MAANNPERITLWTLEDEEIKPEYFGKVNVGGAATLEALRFTFESNEILEWSFEFWDVKDKRRIRNKLKRLNGFCKEVYVIRVRGRESDANKRRRLQDGSFAVSPDEVPAAVKEEPQFLEVEVVESDPTVPAIGSSRVSGTTEFEEVANNPLKSLLLPNSVMDRYFERAKKLKAELKRVAMDDHEWWLKTFDLNGSGVVKLWYAKCKKDCGGSLKDHTKAQIDNLFNNFRRSHIVSIGHVRNYCTAKNINFDDHLQSAAKNGRPVTVTCEDHRNLIVEGVQIVDGVNASLPEGQKKFMVLGNLTAVMILCPPRKTLELNLRNHLARFKHQKEVEDAD